MTNQFTHLKERDTVHHEPTRESMAKIMNMKVRYPWDYEAIHSPQSRAAFKTALAVRSG